MENKSPFKRIPLWTWILIVIFCLGFLPPLFLMGTGKISKKTTPTQQEKKAEKEKSAEEFYDKGKRLNDDIEKTFLTGDAPFIKSHLERGGESYIDLELTIDDTWYYLPEFKQERLLEDAWQTFNLLTEKHGLRKENDMPWKVVFFDRYKKKIAEKDW